MRAVAACLVACVGGPGSLANRGAKMLSPIALMIFDYIPMLLTDYGLRHGRVRFIGLTQAILDCKGYKQSLAKFGGVYFQNS